MTDKKNPQRPNEERPHLLILGAGLAGLSAAREALSARPCRVTLLEKEERPGGLAVSLRMGEFTADLGPHRIYSAIPEMRDWFRNLMGDALFSVSRRSRMYARGRYLRYPPSFIELAKTFGPGLMARFAAGYLAARLRAPSIGPAADSFSEAMARGFGRPFCETLIFPYIRKTWKTPPEEISADTARARATMGGALRVLKRMLFSKEAPGRESTLKTFHYVRGGIESLARRMAEDIRKMEGEILCRATVQRAQCRDGRITRVEYRDASGETRSITADFVVSTIPIGELTESIAEETTGRPWFDAGVREAARGLRFLNETLVYAVLRRPKASEDHWLYFPEKSPPFNRVHEPKNFDESLGPPDRTMLCIEGTALPGDADWLRSDEEIAGEYAVRLAETGLFPLNDLEQTRVHRLENAYPLYDLDYRPRLDKTREALRGISNLLPLGRQGLFQHNNMDHAIYSGIRAARCWAENSAPVSHWHGKEIPSFREFRIVD